MLAAALVASLEAKQLPEAKVAADLRPVVS
jgi:hypothetical protein